MKFIKGVGSLKNKDEIIDALKAGDEEVFRIIYESFRDEFTQWAERHYNVSKDVALDFFQESVTNLYINAYTGNMNMHGASIKTYLFSIGKNKLRNYVNFGDRYHLIDDLDEDGNFLNDVIDEDYYDNKNKEKINAVLFNLSEPCKSILEMNYLQGLSLDTIADKMRYKNKKTLKSTKSRCIQYLKNYLKD